MHYQGACGAALSQPRCSRLRGGVCLGQTQPRLMHAAGMKGYLHLKAQLLYATACLVAGGSFGLYLVDGWHSALPFAGGGLCGVTYQWLLQRGADAIPGGPFGETPASQSVRAPDMCCPEMCYNMRRWRQCEGRWEGLR